MNLKYLTKEAYNTLKKDIEINKEKYLGDDVSWIKAYFEAQGINEYYKESSITVANLTPVYSGEGTDDKNADDLQNVKMFYTEFKDKLTPLQACDPLLWTALCHIDFQEYILKRWKKDDDKIRIDQRFFATGGRTNLTYYNAISRLWWSGYLTYEEEKAGTNPFELTQILFSAQQIQKDLFDQSFSMNKTIIKGLLTALKRIQEERGNACTKVFRKCCDSYINHYGAVSVIDFLSSEEIEDIAYKFMKSLDNQD
ncbi:MAG: DUF6339 family protein [Candidatus Ozemobacteraceae bacterium]|jgi:hypothetical protein